jgi:predicted metal-dependent phosphoesterase TrpH
MDIHGLKEELLQHYPYRIELHAHTSPASGCSHISPREMVDTYVGLEYSGIVITNHFVYRNDCTKQEYIDTYLADFEETQAYGKERGLTVYLGAEIRFTENQNDYLIYGVDRTLLEEVYEYLPHGVEQFRKAYRMPNSLFIQAHPMRDGIQAVDPAWLDGVEVFNMHPGHNARMGVVSLLAKENPSFIVTAGSDFHHPNRNHEGLAAMRTTQLPSDSFELAAMLRSKDFVTEFGRNFVIL